eukprot:15619539-Heterocapsa_arctica.AAC.1
MTWQQFRQLPPPSTRGSSERSSIEPDEGDTQPHVEQPPAMELGAICPIAEASNVGGPAPFILRSS